MYVSVVRLCSHKAALRLFLEAYYGCCGGGVGEVNEVRCCRVLYQFVAVSVPRSQIRAQIEVERKRNRKEKAVGDSRIMLHTEPNRY